MCFFGWNKWAGLDRIYGLVWTEYMGWFGWNMGWFGHHDSGNRE